MLEVQTAVPSACGNGVANENLADVNDAKVKIVKLRGKVTACIHLLETCWDQTKPFLFHVKVRNSERSLIKFRGTN